MGPDDQKETELSAYEKRERKIDDARFLAGVRDIVAYIAFLVLYTIVIQTTGIEMAFPMASKMREEVLGEDFESILVVDDVWGYLDDHFVNTAFLDEGGGDGSLDEMPSGRWGYILDVNRMIGAIQFEQVRVDVGGALPWNATPTCKVPQVFREEIDKCYPSISEGGKATQPFGGSCGCDTSIFSPICAETPCDDSFFAEADDAKYIWTLPINITAASARARLAKLRERRWIDLQTRELNVKLTVYNPAVDLFSAIELQMEMRQSGGVEVAANFKTFNMVRPGYPHPNPHPHPHPHHNPNPHPNPHPHPHPHHNPNPNPDPNPDPNPNPNQVRHMLMLTEASEMFPARNRDRGMLAAD